jgi:hypothetical protein
MIWDVDDGTGNSKHGVGWYKKIGAWIRRKKDWDWDWDREYSTQAS